MAGGPPFTMEQIITDVMIYWVTGSANTASWLYTAARRLGGMRLERGELVTVPTGFLCCPHDLFPAPPDSWIRRVYPLMRRTDLPAGGHFLAYERPGDFVEDVRAFFRSFRGQASSRTLSGGGLRRPAPLRPVPPTAVQPVTDQIS